MDETRIKNFIDSNIREMDSSCSEHVIPDKAKDFLSLITVSTTQHYDRLQKYLTKVTKGTLEQSIVEAKEKMISEEIEMILLAFRDIEHTLHRTKDYYVLANNMVMSHLLRAITKLASFIREDDVEQRLNLAYNILIDEFAGGYYRDLRTSLIHKLQSEKR